VKKTRVVQGNINIWILMGRHLDPYQISMGLLFRGVVMLGLMDTWIQFNWEYFGFVGPSWLLQTHIDNLNLTE